MSHGYTCIKIYCIEVLLPEDILLPTPRPTEQEQPPHVEEQATSVTTLIL